MMEKQRNLRFIIYNTIQKEFVLLFLCTSLKYIPVNASPHRAKFYPLIQVCQSVIYCSAKHFYNHFFHEFAGKIIRLKITFLVCVQDTCQEQQQFGLDELSSKSSICLTDLGYLDAFFHALRQKDTSISQKHNILIPSSTNLQEINPTF